MFQKVSQTFLYLFVMHDGYRKLIGFKYWCEELRLVFKIEMLNYSSGKIKRTQKNLTRRENTES